MFNVGGMELIVIALVALVVLGPDKLPGAIRQVGQVVGELRRISKGFQTDLRGALDEAERDAAAAKKADAAGPRPENHDPGAAQAVAEAELAAIEGAREADEQSNDPVGSEGRGVSDDSASDANPGGDGPTAAAS